jgi:hypothetical protein
VPAEAVVAREEVQEVHAGQAEKAERAVAGQAVGEQASGLEPEELLKKLYDPLVRRLKADLWLDRERRGALTDRWR